MISDSEVWRPITGFEGRYEVSSLGRIQSLDQHGVDKRGRPKFRRGRVLRPSYAGAGGYPRVVLYGPSGKKCVAIHQEVALAFFGPPPAGMEVRHMNGDPTDARSDNLEYGTPKQNQADRWRHGTAQALDTQCRRGHPYTPSNTSFIRNPDGSIRQRLCRTCKRVRQQRYEARIKEQEGHGNDRWP